MWVHTSVSLYLKARGQCPGLSSASLHCLGCYCLCAHTVCVPVLHAEEHAWGWEDNSQESVLSCMQILRPDSKHLCLPSHVSGIPPYLLLIFIWNRFSCWTWPVPTLARLAVQWAPGICLLLAPVKPPYPALYMDYGDLNLDLCTCTTSAFPAQSLPRPHFSLFCFICCAIMEKLSNIF